MGEQLENIRAVLTLRENSGSEKRPFCRTPYWIGLSLKKLGFQVRNTGL
jgi:hypothetical protein